MYRYASFVFFFKQKTAYEMRISGWSSDVCSSDLRHRVVPSFSRHWCCPLGQAQDRARRLMGYRHDTVRDGTGHRYRIFEDGTILITSGVFHHQEDADRVGRHFRSEEHTSELQSLMRISYAVFCLKKKNNQK